MQINFKDGGHAGAEDLHSILQALPLAKKLGQISNSNQQLSTLAIEKINGTGSTAWRQHLLMRLSPSLAGLMQRYGSHNSDELSVGRESAKTSESVKESSDKVQMLLKLKLGSARGVGKFYFFGGADLFCVAFIGRLDSEGMMTCSDLELFQTETKTGNSEIQWTWNRVQYTCLFQIHYVLV